MCVCVRVCMCKCTADYVSKTIQSVEEIIANMSWVPFIHMHQ